MTAKKRDKLRRLGYRVTDSQGFLGLSDREMALIDLKIFLVEKRSENTSSQTSEKTVTRDKIASFANNRASPEFLLTL